MESYSDFLDKNFGELRAPAYIKESELAGNYFAECENVKKYYRCINKRLDEVFEISTECGDTKNYMIWAISSDGALLIGKEDEGKGHPTLTGFQPARIAGELHKNSDGWYITAKSGRYSSDYDKQSEYLKNAHEKFISIFNNQDVDQFCYKS